MPVIEHVSCCLLCAWSSHIRCDTVQNMVQPLLPVIWHSKLCFCSGMSEERDSVDQAEGQVRMTTIALTYRCGIFIFKCIGMNTSSLHISDWSKTQCQLVHYYCIVNGMSVNNDNTSFLIRLFYFIANHSIGLHMILSLQYIKLSYTKLKLCTISSIQWLGKDSKMYWKISSKIKYYLKVMCKHCL